MIPRELPADLGTTAELRVHEALAADDIPGVALHSIMLPEHDYKIMAEADFVLVTEQIVLIVEVKGGGVACRGGLWTYADRQGHSRTSGEGPFKQASSAMFALRDRLEDRLDPRFARELLYGFVVITPDVDLPTSVAWADETYIGRGPFSRMNGLRAGLERAIKYWTARQPRREANLAADVRRAVVDTLRPDFDRTPGLAVRVDGLDATFARLTSEQFAKLDLIIENPRVLCAGGAGTGKTFLAADVARRAARTHSDVLFTCRSPVLASFLRGRLVMSGVEVVALEELPSNRAPADFLVVDEAQDLMSVDALERLDRLVEGGLERGHWAMFHDPNNQAHLYSDHDPEAMDLVRGCATDAMLRTNCRNTKEIAFQTRALTGADTGVAAAGSGPVVEFPQVRAAEEETALLEAHLRHLTEQDVPMRDITLLSLRGDWATSSAANLRDARRKRIRILDETWAGEWPGDGLTWCTPVTVKGLENRFICVIDSDGFRGHADALYVALSRARAGLWVALDPAAVVRVKELYTAHLAGANEVLRRAGR
jgi:hypothetical protein